MKLLCGALLIALTVGGAWTLPARNSPQDDVEVISLPKAPSESSDPNFRDFKGVIDTGSPFLQPNPFTRHSIFDFAKAFDDIFRSFHPYFGVSGSDSDEGVAETPAGTTDSSESNTPFGFRLPSLDNSNGNTTSTVKVVNGHRVEINETVFGDSNSLFKVRLFNLRPLESGEEVIEGITDNHGTFKPASAPSTLAPPKDNESDDRKDEDDRREPLESPKSQDNEVRDIDEPQSTKTNETTETSAHAPAEDAELDTLADPTDNKQTAGIIMADSVAEEQQYQEQELVEYQQKEQELEQEQEHEEEEEEKLQQQMQQLASAQETDTMAHNEEAEMPLPDSDRHNATEPESLSAIENFDDAVEFAEFAVPQSEQLYREHEGLESSEDEDERATPVEMSEAFKEEWASLDADADVSASADPSNNLNNHIDIYEKFVPVDLSNDIAVNDVAAADPDFPYNPDAELIVLNGSGQVMPKFEKLSLSPQIK